MLLPPFKLWHKSSYRQQRRQIALVLRRYDVADLVYRNVLKRYKQSIYDAAESLRALSASAFSPPNNRSRSNRKFLMLIGFSFVNNQFSV